MCQISFLLHPPHLFLFFRNMAFLLESGKGENQEIQRQWHQSGNLSYERNSGVIIKSHQQKHFQTGYMAPSKLLQVKLYFHFWSLTNSPLEKYVCISRIQIVGFFQFIKLTLVANFNHCLTTFNIPAKKRNPFWFTNLLTWRYRKIVCLLEARKSEDIMGKSQTQVIL